MSTRTTGKTIEERPTSTTTKVFSVAIGKQSAILARIEMVVGLSTDVVTVTGGRNLNTIPPCIRQVSVAHLKVANAVRVTVLTTTTSQRRDKPLLPIVSSSISQRIGGQHTANFSSTKSHRCTSCLMMRVELKESNTPKEANSFLKVCMAVDRRVFLWLTRD